MKKLIPLTEHEAQLQGLRNIIKNLDDNVKAYEKTVATLNAEVLRKNKVIQKLQGLYATLKMNNAATLVFPQTAKTTKKIKARLEYLRGEIKAERISYDEIAELQCLVKYIEPDDILLPEWAGVPETV